MSKPILAPYSQRASARPLAELGPGYHLGQDREGNVYMIRHTADATMRQLVRYDLLEAVPSDGTHRYFEAHVWEVPKAALDLIVARKEVP